MQVEAFLKIEPLQWSDSARALGRHTIQPYTHLMQRVDPKLLDALFEPPPAPVAELRPPGSGVR